LPVSHIHAYLVYPGKGVTEPRRFSGTKVQLAGTLFNLLNDVYTKSDRECDTDISFNQSADGRQDNPCRSLITSYLARSTIASGKGIAQRLESVTTHRSGLGLLFLISGNEGLEHKIVISRFPADSAILAEEKRQTLTVEFLERVFMKSATAYKAAAYHHASLQDGFWKGKAVDRSRSTAMPHTCRTTGSLIFWIPIFSPPLPPGQSDLRSRSATPQEGRTFSLLRARLPPR
jgi:hypothetical protein